MGMLRPFRKGEQYKDRAGTVNPNGAPDRAHLEAYSATHRQMSKRVILGFSLPVRKALP